MRQADKLVTACTSGIVANRSVKGKRKVFGRFGGTAGDSTTARGSVPPPRLFPLPATQMHGIRAEFVVPPPRVGEGVHKGCLPGQKPLVQPVLVVQRRERRESADQRDQGIQTLTVLAPRDEVNQLTRSFWSDCQG